MISFRLLPVVNIVAENPCRYAMNNRDVEI